MLLGLKLLAGLILLLRLKLLLWQCIVSELSELLRVWLCVLHELVVSDRCRSNGVLLLLLLIVIHGWAGHWRGRNLVQEVALGIVWAGNSAKDKITDFVRDLAEGLSHKLLGLVGRVGRVAVVVAATSSFLFDFAVGFVDLFPFIIVSLPLFLRHAREIRVIVRAFGVS